MTLRLVSLVLRRNNLPIDAIKEISLYLGLCWQRHSGKLVSMPQPIKLSIPKPIVPVMKRFGIIARGATQVDIYRLCVIGPMLSSNIYYFRYYKPSNNSDGWILDSYSHNCYRKNKWICKTFLNEGGWISANSSESDLTYMT